MRILEKIKISYFNIKASYLKLLTCVTLYSISISLYADPIIPVSTDDETASGTSFATTIISIFQNEIIPIVMIVGAMWVLWSAIKSMMGGIKESQESRNFGPLKDASIQTVIVIVIGSAILYLLNQLRTYSF